MFGITLDQKQKFFTASLVILLAMMPVLAVSIPRFLAIGPAMIAVLALIDYLFLFKQKPQFSKSDFMWVGTILAFAISSTLWALNADFVMERTGKMLVILGPALILFAVCRSAPKDLVQGFLMAIPIALVIGLSLTIFDYLTDYSLYRFVRGIPADGRVAHSVLNRSVVTLTLCFFPALFIALHSLRDQKRKWVLVTVLTLGMLICLSLTKSQTAQLAFIIGAATFLVFPLHWKSAWVALAVFIGIISLSIPWSVEFLYERVAPLIEPNTLLYEASIPHRFEVWQNLSQFIFQSPIYGHGLEATRFITFESTGIYAPGNSILHPHSAAFQIWLEFGVIGVIAALALLLSLLHRLYHVQGPTQRLYLATLLATVSVAMTGYGLWQSWHLGLFILVTAISILAAKTSD